MTSIADAKVGPQWAEQIGTEFEDDYMKNLARKVSKERTIHRIYPSQNEVFRAFLETPYDKVKVVMLGQDPYFRGEANGLAFDCSKAGRLTPSMEKIVEAYQEEYPAHFNTALMDGDLLPWAEQGILLLNSALTVKHGTAGWHADEWTPFITEVIKSLSVNLDPIVFVLMGGAARRFSRYIGPPHSKFELEHPAAAARADRPWQSLGIFGKINAALKSFGKDPIDW